MEVFSSNEIDIKRFLSFTVNDEEYAADISQIREIITFRKMTRIPKAPPFLKGVINLRGAIIPLISMRLKFGLEETANYDDSSIVIFDIQNELIGFIVDSVNDVLAVTPDELMPPPTFSEDLDAMHIQKVIDNHGRVCLVLDIHSIFRAQEAIDLEAFKTAEIAQSKNRDEKEL